MTEEAEVIKFNLLKYPSVGYFLGDIIEQRLHRDSSDIGMLTAHFLDPTEGTKSDLDRLEKALQFGEQHCKDFKQLFQGRGLSQESKIADGQIIDILAEVKAFEFLYNRGFAGITSVRRDLSVKTVDFTATKNNQNYAVEVTRLGLAKSGRKKPKLDKLSRPPLCIIVDSKEPQNRKRIAEDIYDEVIDKYPQIKEFCQRQVGVWKGILVISNGRDYFVAGRYEKKLYELQPRSIAEVLELVWKSLKEDQGNFNHLHYIVVTMDKDLQKAITCPSL